MELVKPGIGLIFWMTLSFGVILFILKKFAWKPILAMLKEREDTIEKALLDAEKARLQMISLKATNEKLLQEAREEREVILKEARQTKDKMVGEAKAKAESETRKMIEQARLAIENEKLAAVTELKNQVATLSIEIAEKVLRAELSQEAKQTALVDNLLKDALVN